MNLTVTLVIQGVVFFLVAWFVMKYFWAWLLPKIEERQKKIADGLAAANKGQKDLDEAQARAQDIVREARVRAAQLIEQAGKRSGEMVEEAKETASAEAQRLLAQARADVAREVARARDGLRREVGKLAIQGASHLLGREIDARAHAELLDKLAAEIAHG